MSIDNVLNCDRKLFDARESPCICSHIVSVIFDIQHLAPEQESKIYDSNVAQYIKLYNILKSPPPQLHPINKKVHK